MVNEQELQLELERAAQEQEAERQRKVVDLKNAIDSFEEMAIGGELYGGELSRQRSLAIDAYAGKNIEPADEGRSQVVDWTVFETIQWILPSLLRIFANGDNIVEFEPVGPEDEPVAEQESNYLNHLVTQDNNWFLTILTWFQDALLTKNAYCLATNNETYEPETERYEMQSEAQVAMILEDDVEVTGQKQNVDYENPVPATDELSQPVLDAFGQPVMQPTITYDLEVRRVKAEKRLKFDVLPPERCKVADNTPDFTLDTCDYFEYWDDVTLSDIRKMGYEVPDDITDSFYTETEEGSARDEIYENSYDLSRPKNTPDASMREVNIRHIWVRHDTDGDGIAELQYVCRIGDTILDVQPVTTIPVACIAPFILTHRHTGMSVADLTYDIQRIKTDLLRNGLDSLRLSVSPRHTVSQKVNLEDMLVVRPGGVVRMLDSDSIPGEGHILPLQTENVFPQAQDGLLHMDTVTEARVGVNRMFQGIDSSNVNDHNRVGQLSTMAAQRVEMIARLFANGVERLMRIAHELIVKGGHQKKAIKLRGQWVDIDPTQWRTGRDLKVTAPFAAGNKDTLLQRLMIVAQYQEKALAGGLPIVTPEDAYELALELAKASDIPGEKFFTDPKMIPPPPPPPDYTALALEIENKKVDQRAQESAQKVESDNYKAELSAENDRLMLEAKGEIELAVVRLKEETALIQTQLKEGMVGAQESASKAAQAATDATAGLVDALSKLQSGNDIAEQIVAQVAQAVSAPKRIIRDENGDIVGVEAA